MIFKLNNQKASRTIFGYENRDPQGIEWGGSMFEESRESFRSIRNMRYNSFRNTENPLEYPNQCINQNCKFFDFEMSHQVQAGYAHFQLRDNVQCIGPEEIYLKTLRNKLIRYNPLTMNEEIVVSPQFTAVSFSVLSNFVALGGNDGELLVTDTEGKQKFFMSLSQEDSRITNCIKFFMDSGTVSLLVCNNDKSLRIIDPETQDQKIVNRFEACVNHATMSPDLKKIGVCLDSTEDYIVDAATGETLYTLVGHVDFGFSVDWDPSNSYYLATGNQDKTVMVWDIRQGSRLTPVHVLHAQLGATLNVKYSKNGKYLAFTESGDYINIFDKKEFKERQVVDFFGEISGFSFCESDKENLTIYVGMADRVYNSIMELKEKVYESILI